MSSFLPSNITDVIYSERPKSFFRDSCIKYLIFSCCCCFRYVAEENDDENTDERDTAMLSKKGGSIRKRAVTLRGNRNRVVSHHQPRRSRVASVVTVYVPEEKDGLPPHWEKVISEDGSIYYWQSLTGETQWENPGKSRGTFARVEMIDDATGRVYYWNQITGSTRWKDDSKQSSKTTKEIVDDVSGKVYLWNQTTGSTRWKSEEV